MATTFPQQIQTFTEKYDITASDASALKLYQQAMESGNVALAAVYLGQIASYRNKIITADEMNTLLDTCEAVQTYVEQAYGQSYVVSSTQPVTQAVGDFWFQVT